MTRPEYNRKMKALGRDLERAKVAIDTAKDRRDEIWRKIDELRDEELTG